MLVGVVFCRERQMRRRNTDSGPVKRRVLTNKSKVGKATPAAPLTADLPGMQQIVDWLKQLGMHEYIHGMAVCRARSDCVKGVSHRGPQYRSTAPGAHFKCDSACFSESRLHARSQCDARNACERRPLGTAAAAGQGSRGVQRRRDPDL